MAERCSAPVHHAFRQSIRADLRIVLLGLFVIGDPLTTVAFGKLPYELEGPARALVVELVAQAKREGWETAGTMAVVHLGGTGQSARLAGDLEGFLRAETGKWDGVESVTLEGVRKVLEDRFYDLPDLGREEVRRAIYPAVEVEWMLLARHVVRDEEVVIDVALERTRPLAWFRREVGIFKSDEIYAYLGEPVPRTLFVAAPRGSQVWAGGKAVGIVGREPLPARLAAGRHTVSVSVEGYPPYTGTVEMNGRQDHFVEVGVRDNAGAPLKSLLAGAILPGLSLPLYGNPVTPEGNRRGAAENLVILSATTVYVGLGVWLIDELKSPDFLTDESASRHRKIKKVELGIAAGGYALNLIGSVIVGSEFAQKNRQLVRTAERPVAALVPAVPSDGLAVRPLREDGATGVAMLWTRSF